MSHPLWAWRSIVSRTTRKVSKPNRAPTTFYARRSRQLSDNASPTSSQPTSNGEGSDRRSEGGTGSEESYDQKQHQQGPKKNRGRGVTLPAFAVFAVALPVGWYIKSWVDGHESNKIAKPGEFVRYTLVGKDHVSSTCAIFHLRPTTAVVIDQDDPDLERALVSVEFKQPQLQIARSYTCLPQQQGQHMDELRFLIRKEHKGEVSNYLHNLDIGAEIELRGLRTERKIPDNVESVAFLVGGTGIAPALQAADKLQATACLYILWASRRREDCVGGYNDNVYRNKSWNLLSRSSAQVNHDQDEAAIAEKGLLVTMLERLKHQPAAEEKQRLGLMVDYFVDEEGTTITSDDVKQMLNTLRGGNDPAQTSGRHILFVSGPEGFISRWAGPKQWANGREIQGPLRGVLSTLDLRGWEVYKL